MKRLIIFLTVLTLIILNSCKDKVDKSEIILATWDGGEINLAEFEEFAMISEFEYDTLKASEAKTDKKIDILNNMIERELTIQLAGSLKLDTIPELQKKFNDNLKQIAYRNYLLPDSVYKKIITEKDIKDTYNRLKHKYKVSHILLVTEGKNENKVKTRIDSIYNAAVSNPDSFAELAQKLSDDVRTGRNGGDLGWNFSPAYLVDFENAIIKLEPGEISKPFKTTYGWHIAKLDDKSYNFKLKPFELEKSNAANYALNQRSEKYNKISEQFKDMLYDKYNVKLDSSKIKSFSTELRTALKKEGSLKEILDDMDHTVTLVSLSKDSITTGDIIGFVAEIGTKEEINVTEKNVFELIYNTINNKVSSFAVVDLGYTKDPEIMSVAEYSLYSEYETEILDYYKVKEELKNDWYDKLINDFNVKYIYTAIERSFYYIIDNKK